MGLLGRATDKPLKKILISDRDGARVVCEETMSPDMPEVEAVVSIIKDGDEKRAMMLLIVPSRSLRAKNWKIVKPGYFPYTPSERLLDAKTFPEAIKKADSFLRQWCANEAPGSMSAEEKVAYQKRELADYFGTA